MGFSSGSIFRHILQSWNSWGIQRSLEETLTNSCPCFKAGSARAICSELCLLKFLISLRMVIPHILYVLCSSIWSSSWQMVFLSFCSLALRWSSLLFQFVSVTSFHFTGNQWDKSVSLHSGEYKHTKILFKISYFFRNFLQFYHLLLLLH